MVHLHARCEYSLQAGASSPLKLVQAAAQDGQTAMALTDVNNVAGAVQFALACRDAGLKPIFGAEVTVDNYPLVLIAADREGYANLTDILTAAHQHDPPNVTLEQVEPHAEGLICLTGDRWGKLATACRDGEYDTARSHLSALKWLFHKRLFVELTHHHRPGDMVLIATLSRLAAEYHVPVVATNAVRHAAPQECPVYDALTCAGLGLTVADPHPLRPVNNQAYVRTAQEMRESGFFSKSALANSDAIARLCNVELLRDEVVPPQAHIPTGTSPDAYLRQICFEAFLQKYPPGHKYRTQAAATLKKEARIITELGLGEFFLVVREVMFYARSRGIRCSGRGSAANSLVAYLLGITGVDPIEHGLLFERFLHAGRRGMPDIDCDFETHRRGEVIEWMERRFTNTHTAMTANVVTYRLKNAVKDMAKVLGYPLPLVNAVAHVIPNGYAHDARQYRAEMASVLGESPLLETLICLVEALNGCPRHLSQHSGGMILSRQPIRYVSPILTSANGVRQMVFNKDDAEKLGLIKFDVLGLRMLSTISEALALQEEDTGSAPDVDTLPLDDPATYELICSGKTMGLFQIESGGQWNLLSKSQPENLRDLTAQVALFRPGPLQANMVHPYIGRRRGMQRVQYPHPSLEPCLRDTYGIILYQEQVLEVASAFAGLPLNEADEFRRLMSRFRSPEEMEGMRAKFVNGAISTHNVSPALANHVFNMISKYVGYGFCKSHAAEFARTVYISAYLKAHYPAAYMAGVLQHQPGFYPLQTMIEEARQFGVTVLPVDILHSDIGYKLESGAIRVPFTQVQNIGVDAAARIVLERWSEPFQSLEDAYRRVRLDADVWVALVRAGAFDSFGERRKLLYDLRILAGQLGTSGQEQLALDETAFAKGDYPPLDQLDLSEMLEWDFATKKLTTEEHPMAMHRNRLEQINCRRIAYLMTLPPKQKVLTAGVVISRQHPPTARGMTFIILEDETGRIPTAIVPQAYAKCGAVLREPGLLVEGVLEGSGKGQVGPYRSILIRRMWPLSNVVGKHEGGYRSFPGQMAR